MNLGFYLTPVTPPLFGREGKPEDDIVVLGIPFDGAASRIPGQRFAPRKVREVSVELETFSPELGVNVEEIGYRDAGDLPVVTDYAVMQNFTTKVVEELRDSGKLPIVIGGDHSVTFPVVSTLAARSEELLVLVFDAHMDLRDEWPWGVRLSHATVMRRLLESSGSVSVAYYSPRAFSREEYEYARSSSRVKIVRNARELRELVESSEKVYISLDIDAVDPAYAPGTGTPEPMGLAPQEVASALRVAVSHAQEVAGFDVVEVNPLVDCNEITSLLAAKLVMEFLFACYRYEKCGARQARVNFS
ncbi:agmatinase [Infirmifilum sp. SLHALR2]